MFTLPLFKDNTEMEFTSHWAKFRDEHFINLSTIGWTVKKNSILKKYNAYHNVWNNKLEFESEEDMLMFLMEWS